jgi:hypothetical protein
MPPTMHAARGKHWAEADVHQYEQRQPDHLSLQRGDRRRMDAEVAERERGGRDQPSHPERVLGASEAREGGLDSLEADTCADRREHRPPAVEGRGQHDGGEDHQVGRMARAVDTSQQVEHVSALQTVFDEPVAGAGMLLDEPADPAVAGVGARAGREHLVGSATPGGLGGLDHRCPHGARLEQADAVAPAALGRIEGRVGAVEQGLVLEARIGRGGGDAERHRHLQPAHELLAHPRAQALGDSNGGVGVGVGEEHDELLSADPIDGLEGPQARLQPARHLLEHLVADAVPVLVVDLPEVVEVTEHHYHGGVGQRALVG